MPLGSFTPEHDGKAAIVGGSIVDIREITTKNGQKMAFVKIEDKFGEIEAILFPGAYQQTVGLWERDRVVLIRGKISAKDRDGNIGSELKLMVDDAREITVAQAQAYQSTGKKRKVPKPKGKTPAVSATPATTSEEMTLAPKRIYVRLPDSDNHDLLLALKQAIDEQPGEDEVVLVVGADASKQIIRLPGRVSSTEPALSRLQSIVGTSNVKYQ